MTDNSVLFQFNQAAITCHLSGGAMQLWTTLLQLTIENDYQPVVRHASALQTFLQMSSRQFYRVRQALVKSGFLQTIKIGQRTCYTLLLSKKQIFLQKPAENPNFAAVTADSSALAEGAALEKDAAKSEAALNDTALQESTNAGQIPDRQTPNRQKDSKQKDSKKGNDGKKADLQMRQSGLQTEGFFSHYISRADYHAAIEDFCAPYQSPYMLRHLLLQWAEMRLKNGWTLTVHGLEAMLENLRDLGAGCADTMVQIVKQTIDRRWKGFYSYQQNSRPSGTRLKKLEEKERQEEERRLRNQPKALSKFKSEHRDLSFLEE